VCGSRLPAMMVCTMLGVLAIAPAAAQAAEAAKTDAGPKFRPDGPPLGGSIRAERRQARCSPIHRRNPKFSD